MNYQLLIINCQLFHTFGIRIQIYFTKNGLF